MLAAALVVEMEKASADSGASDAALAAAGDRRAFERLYKSHVNRVFSLCARMCGDRDHAEELTQDVFVRAWEKLPQFRGESAFGTWIHRVAVNVVLNDRKTAGRERSRAAPDAVEDEVDDPEARYGGRDAPRHADRMDIEAAIAMLPPGARRVFVLHDVEGYKHEEIAEMLGVTSGGTKAQLHRARMLLREALER
jgi:RNA polymerase sigma-70 factor (ECF subfamily)